MPKLDPSQLRAADPLQPWYYLHNARTLINHCYQLYSDLLTPWQQQWSAWQALGQEAQALLVRMLMRKGELFFARQLIYSEIKHPEQALAELQALDWLEPDPEVSQAELANCLTLAQVKELLAQRLGRVPSKLRANTWLGLLPADTAEHQAWSAWWPQGPRLYRVKHQLWWQELQLLFFGNAHQDMTDFVLSELQTRRYEPLPWHPDNRPFANREQLLLYQQLNTLAKALEAGEPVCAIAAQLMALPELGWMTHSRDKLMLRLGLEAQRQGNLELAEQLWHTSQHPEAKVRLLRLLKPRLRAAELVALGLELRQGVQQPEYWLALERVIWPRQPLEQRQWLGQALTAPKVTSLVLAKGEQRVEQQVLQAMAQQGWQGQHVENHLFVGLFALCFWPAIFAPVKGAFFNPFQDRPRDLFHPDFASRRQDIMADCWQQWQREDYRQLLLERWQAKQGTACSLIHWPKLPLTLVEQALACIAKEHLTAIFTRLWQDLRHHSRGLPDLILFDQQGNYQLMEVKSPTDRLQDQQRLWLAFMQQQGIPACVCQVRWQ